MLITNKIGKCMDLDLVGYRGLWMNNLKIKVELNMGKPLLLGFLIRISKLYLKSK